MSRDLDHIATELTAVATSLKWLKEDGGGKTAQDKMVILKGLCNRTLRQLEDMCDNVEEQAQMLGAIERVPTAGLTQLPLPSASTNVKVTVKALPELKEEASTDVS